MVLNQYHTNPTARCETCDQHIDSEKEVVRLRESLHTINRAQIKISVATSIGLRPNSDAPIRRPSGRGIFRA